MPLSTTLMPVPKTSVDENYCFIFRQDNIGCSRQVFDMYPKAQAIGVQKTANHNFGARILAANSSHTIMALLRCHPVCHSTNSRH